MMGSDPGSTIVLFELFDLYKSPNVSQSPPLHDIITVLAL